MQRWSGDLIGMWSEPRRLSLSLDQFSGVMSRGSLRSGLEEFGRHVTSFLALEKVQTVDATGEEEEETSEEEIVPPPQVFSEQVSRYGEAVERAASDLSRRRTRISSVDAIIREAMVEGVFRAGRCQQGR